ncbi:protein-disulfide reductase DsbD domain-containing protein [Cognatishimia sp. F0-27]|uniref:protein-disulfide reductase DsbD domain-containing protein n=1 Tax=Cognatishimia sp. F0-27 TaxID=2816855 RepID=UPI001D0C5739|nr:protein-disulfide reductase DsbD domain-containing protein [Cognatishimia sp. F0-27]MCC1494217.1 hypothetical protein [Cognatishimia sp. F0-27]
MKRLLCLLLWIALPGWAFANPYADVVESELRPGWRLADGTHMAALHLKLAPGWKTYWRAPGDAGIPPLFGWSGAQNLRSVAVHWPVPEVFWQSGMRSVGYENEVVLPLRVTLRDPAQAARLKGVVDIGICYDVCLPHRVRFDAMLPPETSRPDPRIAAALADQPLSASEAGVRSVRCAVAPSADGLTLTAEIQLRGRAGPVDTVIETADPQVWVAEPDTQRRGSTISARTELRHMSGSPFALDRSGVRITVLTGSTAIDIRGCSG